MIALGLALAAAGAALTVPAHIVLNAGQQLSRRGRRWAYIGVALMLIGVGLVAHEVFR